MVWLANSNKALRARPERLIIRETGAPNPEGVTRLNEMCLFALTPFRATPGINGENVESYTVWFIQTGNRERERESSVKAKTK